ncbi:phage scaffolding protein [Pediococcus acidilactici]|uniref:phage scaffolding protein n=2 Tax=Pediococcus acidilactici TaxID=1254 RepID=UPI0013261C3D|nr:phage scaffolding protein [Pediococcus acidilactici]KAF0340600.1 capsid protein [Pediococcus acidilactici]KAF0380525.1 capsid protein [Pediococcus acidilactici]KAF0439753.1 capsid protein [Pediococcus acidilactici]KAF0453482.1 capsid protein [Pediococcus acidilactici]KAF0463100.1 capsid protein [Pediococcus acidilactici]
MSMKREDLQGLGLSDEQVNSVMAKHSAELNDMRTKLTSAEQERDSLKGQLESNQSELAKFKDSQKDNEALQDQLKELQGKFDEVSEQSANELAQVRKESAIDLALVKSGARNPKAVKALLDNNAIKLDDEGMHGLNDQLESLKESDGYLFEGKEPDKPNPFAGGNPSGGTPANDNKLAEALGLKEK